MMTQSRLFSLSLLFLLLSGRLMGQLPDFSAESLGFQPQTRTATLVPWECHRADGQIIKGKRLPDEENAGGIFEFTEKGNLARTVLYSESWETELEKKFSYDEAGHLSQIKVLSPTASKKYSVNYKYDSRGNMIREERRFLGRLQYRLDFSYDDQDNCILLRKWGPDNTLRRQISYNYNQHNQKLSEDHFGSSGDTLNSFSYTWDQAGNLVEIRESRPGKGVFQTKKQSFDDRGNPIEVWAMDAAGQEVFHATMEYNDRGHKIREQHYRPDGSATKLEEWELTYDEKGNITQKVLLVNGTVIQVTEGSFKYLP